MRILGVVVGAIRGTLFVSPAATVAVIIGGAALVSPSIVHAIPLVRHLIDIRRIRSAGEQDVTIYFVFLAETECVNPNLSPVHHEDFF